jgi:hypothetical protein
VDSAAVAVGVPCRQAEDEDPLLCQHFGVYLSIFVCFQYSSMRLSRGHCCSQALRWQRRPHSRHSPNYKVQQGYFYCCIDSFA